MSSKTVEYLVSAEYLLENIDTAGDYSPVIIQYGRAVENELKRIFLSIRSGNWLLGPMEISLKNFFNGTIDYPQLPTLLNNMFIAPAALRIDLLEDIRKIRNSAAHAGATKTRQEALDYIAETKDFLDNWIATQK